MARARNFRTAVEIDDAGRSVTFNLIGNSGRIPSRVSDDSAWYQLFSSEMKVIESGCRCVMETNVTVSMHRGFHGRICNRAGSGLSAQTVSGDIIDGEYKRTIRIIVYNYGMRQKIILAGDPIGLMIVQQYFVPSRRVCRRLDFGLD